MFIENAMMAFFYYKKAAELKPNDAFIYISLGNIYETQSKYQDALDAYNQATKLFPEYKYNYLNIANVQTQMKDYKDAISNYNLFLETYAQHAEARKSLANTYFVSGDYEKAAAEYDTLYAKNPQNFPVAVNFAIFLVNDAYGFFSWKEREKIQT